MKIDPAPDQARDESFSLASAFLDLADSVSMGFRACPLHAGHQSMIDPTIWTTEHHRHVEKFVAQFYSYRISYCIRCLGQRRSRPTRHCREARERSLSYNEAAVSVGKSDRAMKVILPWTLVAVRC